MFRFELCLGQLFPVADVAQHRFTANQQTPVVASVGAVAMVALASVDRQVRNGQLLLGKIVVARVACLFHGSLQQCMKITGV
jgi:hypothetical protein